MSGNIDPQLKLRLLWLGIGYLLIALVILLSLTSQPVFIGLPFAYEDKVYHTFAYFALMAWFAQIYHGRLQRNITAVFLISLGLLLEYLQSLNPARYAEYGDMLANTTGVALGYALALSKAKNILVGIEKLIR